MKYLVIGAGGTGGSIGAYMTEAGKDVTLIARGEHLRRMQERGLRMETTKKGNYTVYPIKATDMEHYDERPDVIFVCVKGYSLDETIPFIRRVAKESTIVIPILNLYGTGGRMQEKLPGLLVTDGCIYIAGEIKEPGTILLIGERTAEDLKIKIGSAYPRTEVDYMDVRGRNLVTGLPRTVKVSSEETEEALHETTVQIVETIHSVLEKTPPELAADIADRGIVLTGGGSLLRGLEDLIAAKTGINTMTAEDPMTAVAVGTGKYVEFLAGYREE